MLEQLADEEQDVPGASTNELTDNLTLAGTELPKLTEALASQRYGSKRSKEVI